MERRRYTKEDWKWVLQNASPGTIYDRRHGVTVVGFSIAYEDDQIMFCISDKSDGQRQLDVIYRMSRDSPYWLRFTPTKDQAIRMINMFPVLYDLVEKHNKEIWRAEG